MSERQSRRKMRSDDHQPRSHFLRQPIVLFHERRLLDTTTSRWAQELPSPPASARHTGLRHVDLVLAICTGDERGIRDGRLIGAAARALCEQALAEAPLTWPGRLNALQMLARVARRQQDWPRALEALNEVLRLVPDAAAE